MSKLKRIVVGKRTEIEQLQTEWFYDLEQCFIGIGPKDADCVALCPDVDVQHACSETFTVSDGGLFSWMVPGLLSKLVARIPVSRSHGEKLEDFYCDNRPLCPTLSQLEAFQAGDQDRPCYMLNFFKYRSVWRILAYGTSATRHQHQLRSNMVWSARCHDEHWEEVAIFRYPTRRAFLEMLSRKNYQQAELRFREAGWADTKLYVLG